MEIKLEQVCYKDKINNLTHTFESNKITSIIGKIDSGMKLVLDLIYGSIKPDKGIITKVDSVSLSKNNDLFNITIMDDLTYNYPDIDMEKLNYYLREFSLNDILDKTYIELSSGDKKKVSIISSLIKNKDVILLDNPTVNLDSKSLETLVRILKKEKHNDKTIIIVSTDSNFVLQISDNVVVFDNKKVMIASDKKTIMTNKNILNKIKMDQPNILDFIKRVEQIKEIKLVFRDNINDLIKDIYRNA